MQHRHRRWPLAYLRTSNMSQLASNSSDDYSYDYIYDRNSTAVEVKSEASYLNFMQTLYIIVYAVSIVLGTVLNSAVILILTGRSTCCRSRSDDGAQNSSTLAWVMALALTQLVFSAFLVPQLFYAWYHFNWQSNAILCKLSSYVFYACMFTGGAALSIWSVARIRNWKKCPFSSITILPALVSMTLGTILGIPSLLSRELRNTKYGVQCIDDYDLNTDETTDAGRQNMFAVVLMRFMLGVMVPALVMGLAWCFGRRRGRGEAGNRQEKVVGAIKVAYLVCWTPLLFLGIIQLALDNDDNANYLKYGMPVGTILASAYSFVNPLVYLLVGRSIKMSWISENRSREQML